MASALLHSNQDSRLNICIDDKSQEPAIWLGTFHAEFDISRIFILLSSLPFLKSETQLFRYGDTSINPDRIDIEN